MKTGRAVRAADIAGTEGNPGAASEGKCGGKFEEQAGDEPV